MSASGWQIKINQNEATLGLFRKRGEAMHPKRHDNKIFISAYKLNIDSEQLKLNRTHVCNGPKIRL